MTNYPLEEWSARNEEIKKRLFPETGKSPVSSTAISELAPEYAELIQIIARGRSYADPTIDLKTRALCTVACLVGVGDERFLREWIPNAMEAGASEKEIVELLIQLFTYAGSPNSVMAFEVAKAAFDRRKA